MGNPAYQYMDGAKVYIEFTKISPGVDLYIRASSDVTNTTSGRINNFDTSKPVTSVLYSLDQGDNLIITAVPKKARTDTDFEFKFYTDGKEYEQMYAYYHKFFKQDGEKGEILFYIAAGCAGLLAILFLCCIVCCIKMCCCKKKNQIVDSSVGAYSEMAKLARSREAGENNLSATEGAGGDLELESIHGSNDGDITGHGESVPTIMKQSKEDREKEMKAAYANPFKKNRM